MKKTEKWLQEMRLIWLEKRPDDIASLLSVGELEYHEHPLQPPLTKVSDVVSAWQEIRDQDIEFVDIIPLYADDKRAAALWRFKMKNESLHVGSYFLELDKNGKCTHFRQWWNV